MKIVNVPRDKEVTFESGAVMSKNDGTVVKCTESATFWEFLEGLVYNCAELGKGGTKGARTARKLLKIIDDAEASKKETLSFEDADYELLKKTHTEIQRHPRVAVAMADWFEEFENPLAS